MVAFSDLTQVMQNARTDAKTIDEYVHGAADTQVTSRLGKRYWTLATLDNKLSLVKTKAETTLADIDTLATSATDSITAKSNSANTTIDNKAAQANSDIVAKVASANTAIDAQVASIDTRADSEIANLQSAINAAAAAGAGANGWTDLLIQLANGRNLRDKLSDLRITVKDFGAKGDGIKDDSAAFQKAVTYCELNKIRALHIPNGNYLLNTPVNFYKGNVRLVGEGTHQREDSYQQWAVNSNLYPSEFASKVTDIGVGERLGCTIIVPKNSKAFVYAKSVTENISIENLAFVAKEGLTIGNTYAIDFRGEWGGPVLNFNVEKCLFIGFNRAVNFESPAQYCIGFVKFYNNTFGYNDECVYFADITDTSKWDAVGSRNLTWGLTFEHNHCVGNARVIRATIAKDMCRISQNDFEASVAYSDGTHPKYSIDLELTNCFVLFEGNHSENTKHDLFFATTYMRKPDGTRHVFKNNQTRGAQTVVELKANNFDGFYAPYRPVTLEGLSLYDYDISTPVNLHGVSILDTKKTYANYTCSDEAKLESSSYVFPLGSFEYIIDRHNNGLSYIDNVADGLTNHRTALTNTPLGQRQLTKVVALESEGYFFNYTNMPLSTTANYFGVSILVNINKDTELFKSGATCFVDYTVNGEAKHIDLESLIISGIIKNGWNIITAIYPRSVLPTDAIITGLHVGFFKGSLVNESILIDTNITVFNIDTDTYNPAPYFVSNKVGIKKLGTFEVGQMFYDDTSVLNVCKQVGTIGGDISATATGNNGSMFFLAQDTANAKKLSVGTYVSIMGVTYKTTNIVDNKVYLDKPLQATISNAAITFAAPVFSTVTLT